MCQFAAVVARRIACLEACGDIHAGGQDRTSSRISHLGCNSDLRPPAIRNLARSVPIFAISRTGGNPNDSDHRIQQGSLDFDDDLGLDAPRLVRGRHGPGVIAFHYAGRRPSTDGRFAFGLPARASRWPPQNGGASRPGDEAEPQNGGASRAGDEAERSALARGPGAQVCKSGPESAVPSRTCRDAARRGPGRRLRRRGRVVVFGIVVSGGGSSSGGGDA